MPLAARIASALAPHAAGIDLFSLLDAIARDGGRAVDRDQVRRTLEDAWRFIDLGGGRWADGAVLFRGAQVFAIPDENDVAVGRLPLVGRELGLLFRPARAAGTLRLRAGGAAPGGTAADGIALAAPRPGEPADGLALTGLGPWYAAQGFVPLAHVAWLTCEDWLAPAWSITREPSAALDERMDDGMRSAVGDLVAAWADGRPEAQRALPVAPETALLALFGDAAGRADLARGPLNLSYYLSLDPRFALRGDGTFTPCSPPTPAPADDFTAQYLGGDVALGLPTADLADLDAALDLLFDGNRPREAAAALRALKLRHPGEKLLAKFLYQACEGCEDEDGVLRHAEEYAQAFPRDPDPRRALGEARFRRGDLVGARAALDEALALVHPADDVFRADLLTALVYVHWEAGDETAALAAARQALALDPGNAELGEFLAAEGYAPRVGLPRDRQPGHGDPAPAAPEPARADRLRPAPTGGPRGVVIPVDFQARRRHPDAGPDTGPDPGPAPGR